MPEYDTSTATRSRWRSPVFVGVFVPAALAWLIVVGWLTWMYFNPVARWLNGLDDAFQEIAITVIWVLWTLLVAFGLAIPGVIADRLAGIPHSNNTGAGQTAGRHAGWTPPKHN